MSGKGDLGKDLEPSPSESMEYREIWAQSETGKSAGCR